VNVHYIQPFVLTLVAGLSTAIGSLVFIFLKRFEASRLVFLLGVSAGAMLYISFVELLRVAIVDLGFIKANLYFIAGMALMFVIDVVIPHQYIQEEEKGVDIAEKKLYRTGVLVALGIAIHNLPEGLAVFISAVADMKLGVALATAIAIHNIPEGIAVAVPIYYATKSRSKAFIYSVLSGLAEPVGALLGIYLLQSYLSKDLIGMLFAFVAGIMVFISLDELLPQVFGNKHHHGAIQGVMLGMLLVMLSLAI
jgi:zinc transporter, ZIP family